MLVEDVAPEPRYRFKSFNPITEQAEKIGFAADSGNLVTRPEFSRSHRDRVEKGRG